MRAVSERHTKPEVLLRKLLHACGYRFRLHRADLPGRPDIVLPRYRAAVFVHGCFWHGHECRYGRPPKSNPGYWLPKLERNRERDIKNQQQCRQLGWMPIVVWQCELKQPEEAMARLRKVLDQAIAEE